VIPTDGRTYFQHTFASSPGTNDLGNQRHGSQSTEKLNKVILSYNEIPKVNFAAFSSLKKLKTIYRTTPWSVILGPRNCGVDANGRLSLYHPWRHMRMEWPTRMNRPPVWEARSTNQYPSLRR